MMDARQHESVPSLHLTRGRLYVAALVLLTGAALVSANTDILLHLAEGTRVPFWYPLIWEFTGYYTALLFVPVFYASVRRWPLVRGVLPQRLALHLVLAAVFSTFLTTLFWLLRVFIYRVFDLGEYQYGILGWRYLFEFQKFLVFYAFLHILVWLHGTVERSREKEAVALRLSQQLTEARLQSLVAQVNPHFLFNTLNTVSSVMYDDPRAADRMISRLGELLRASISHSTHHLVPLAEEERLLGLYVDLMKARFGPRLEVSVLEGPGAGEVPVPAFLLQPLVENAIKHHPSDSREAIRIRVSAALGPDILTLEVEDNGAFGEESLVSSTGTGLRNLRSRLDHLYGARHRLSFESGETGGLRVRILLPLAPDPPQLAS